MTLDQWIAVAAVLVPVIVAAIAASVRLGNRLTRIEAQYRNNGGSTARDAIDRIETAAMETRDDVKELGSKVNDHLVQSAAKDAEQDTKLSVLMAEVGRRLQ